NKNLHQWLPDYARHLARRARSRRGSTPHVLFALCDHYEPLHGHAPDDVGRARVDTWVDGYARLDQFRDSNGRAPRHGWFFPGEEYRPYFLDRLGDLVKRGFGEVEVHLHHDGDTSTTLAEKLEATLGKFGAHGHLSRAPDDRRYRWAF